MKIVDAYWEKRNLGVDAVSFYIEEKDELDNVLPIILNNKKTYQTAIIDPAKPEIMLELQKHQFRFIECALSLSATSDRIHIPKSLNRFENQMGYRPVSKDEQENILETIKKGEIFKTDKISLDPAFGVKKAGIRYSYWIRDLIDSGNNLYAITFGNETIAFDVAGITEGIVEHYLGGMLPCKKGRMLGAAISVPALLYWKKHGAMGFKTVVSSNNPPILKIHQSFGFEVNCCKHVFIKHLA